MNCDPNTLLSQSNVSQLAALNPSQRDAIKIWLLATIAGVSTDKDYLVGQASCLIDCQVPYKAIEVSLLCTIANTLGA